MTWEAAQPGADARRALYARFVLEHRLSAQDPLESGSADWERDAAEPVFSEAAGFASRNRRIACGLTFTELRSCGPARTGYHPVKMLVREDRGMISEHDVQAYRRDGVIVVPDVLGADVLSAVRR